MPRLRTRVETPGGHRRLIERTRLKVAEWRFGGGARGVLIVVVSGLRLDVGASAAPSFSPVGGEREAARS